MFKVWGGAGHKGRGHTNAVLSDGGPGPLHLSPSVAVVLPLRLWCFCFGLISLRLLLPAPLLVVTSGSPGGLYGGSSFVVGDV